MSPNWKTCKCGNRMKTKNIWDDKTRLQCSKCERIRHVKHIVISEIIKVKLPSKK